MSSKLLPFLEALADVSIYVEPKGHLGATSYRALDKRHDEKGKLVVVKHSIFQLPPEQHASAVLGEDAQEESTHPNLKDVQREYDVLSTVHSWYAANQGLSSDDCSPRVVRPIDFFQRPDPVSELAQKYGSLNEQDPDRGFLVTEYIGFSNLQRTGSPRLLSTVFKNGVQLFEGAYHFHKAGQAHRDLKPENVINASGFMSPNLIIIDAGSAGPKSDKSGHTEFTYEFASPETILDGYDSKADTYSIGAILFELIYGRIPRGPQDTSHMSPTQIAKAFTKSANDKLNFEKPLLRFRPWIAPKVTKTLDNLLGPSKDRMSILEATRRCESLSQKLK